MIALGSQIKILKGRKAPEVFEKPQQKSLRYLQIEDLRPDTTLKYARDSQGVIARETDVLIAWDGANAGTVGWNLTGYTGSTLAILRPLPGRINASYLGFFLHSNFTYLQDYTTGATIPHLKRQVLESLKIPLPPLAEQQRIADILSRADRLRRLRRFALEMSAGYLQAVFLEMFGDPVTNPMGWEGVKLGRLIRGFEAGVNFPPVSEGVEVSKWRVLKISAVTWGEFDPTESKPISAATKFRDSIVARRGDLLMSRANTTELVGAVCRIRTEPHGVLLPDKLWRLCFLDEGSKVMPDYILFALRQPELRRIIGVLATGSSGSMKNISMQKAATLPILVPPLDIQERFTQLVMQYERLRTQQQEALRQAEHLFQGLLQAAFREEV
jgi:type I restriction enzyme S subunit